MLTVKLHIKSKYFSLNNSVMTCLCCKSDFNAERRVRWQAPAVCCKSREESIFQPQKIETENNFGVFIMLLIRGMTFMHLQWPWYLQRGKKVCKPRLTFLKINPASFLFYISFYCWVKIWSNYITSVHSYFSLLRAIHMRVSYDGQKLHKDELICIAYLSKGLWVGVWNVCSSISRPGMLTASYRRTVLAQG